MLTMSFHPRQGTEDTPKSNKIQLGEPVSLHGFITEARWDITYRRTDDIPAAESLKSLRLVWVTTSQSYTNTSACQLISYPVYTLVKNLPRLEWKQGSKGPEGEKTCNPRSGSNGFLQPFFYDRVWIGLIR